MLSHRSSFFDLCASASRALHGWALGSSPVPQRVDDGSPSAIDDTAIDVFAAVQNEALRCNLATELLQDAGYPDEGWRRMLCRALADARVDSAIIDQASSTADSTACASRFARGPFDQHVDVPLCLRLFVSSPRNTAFRLQAVRSFPFLTALAVLVAHVPVPRRRALAAWKVIDAIDAGRRLVPALCALYRLEPAEVRASRVIRALPWPSSDAWLVARWLIPEISRMSPLRRDDCRPTLDLTNCLRLLRSALSARWRGLEPQDHHEECEASEPRSADGWKQWLRLRRSCLKDRALIERLGSGRGVLPLRLAELASRAGLGAWTLPSGWSARSLHSRRLLKREGRIMRSCIGELEPDEGIAFAMTSPSRKERLSLVVDCMRKGSPLSLRLAGMSNSVPTHDGLRAALELAESTWPDRQVVSFHAI